MVESTQLLEQGAATYRTGIDFCKIFTEEMNSLYLLAYLLTADSDKAEQCFVGGLGECVESTGAFMEWAHSWARRTIIKQAIRTIMPSPEYADPVSFVNLHGTSTCGQYGPIGGSHMGAIVALSAFERFVFVMSVLEGQSDADCSSLLNCSRPDVMIARELTLRRLNPAGIHYQFAVA
jgi:hypothetical protein